MKEEGEAAIRSCTSPVFYKETAVPSPSLNYPVNYVCSAYLFIFIYFIAIVIIVGCD